MRRIRTIAVTLAFAACLPAAAQAVEVVDLRIPPPAVAEVRVLSADEARNLWREEFRGEMPADLVSFAIPDIQAGYHPDLANGALRAVEIGFGVRAVRLIRVDDPRLDSCMSAARDATLASARQRIAAIDGAARRSVLRQMNALVRSGALSQMNGDVLRGIGDRVEPVLVSVRRVVLESITQVAFVRIAAVESKRCGAAGGKPTEQPRPTNEPTPAPTGPAPEAGDHPNAHGTPDAEDYDAMERHLRTLQSARGRRS